MKVNIQIPSTGVSSENSLLMTADNSDEDILITILDSAHETNIYVNKKSLREMVDIFYYADDSKDDSKKDFE